MEEIAHMSPFYEGDILTVKQTAIILHFSPDTIYRMLKSGELNGSVVRSRWKIIRSEVGQYVATVIKEQSWRQHLLKTVFR